MKNITKNIILNIILSVVIILSALIFNGTASASESSLYVLPAGLDKNVGDLFSLSVGVKASGNKVCAVEGKMIFNNLSCQKIIVSNDFTAQSAPTCLNPYFLIGIPNCVISDKTFLTVSVKPVSVGTASINISGVDIIGDGASVGSVSTGGNYTISALQTVQQETTPPVQQTENNIPASVGAASLSSIIPDWFKYVGAALTIAIILYGIYYFFDNFKLSIVKKKKKIM